MVENKSTVWKSDPARQLAAVLVGIDSEKDMRNFLRDVMTEKEIIEVSSRLKAASMLQAGSTYSDIVAKTKLSSRTVARISDWMQNGCSGYKIALNQVNHHDHIPPARAV